MVSTKNRSKWALPIVAIVFVLATILQLLTPAPVYADTESDIHDMNYKYYAARYLRDCLFNLDSRFKNSIAQNALNEGTWLYSGYKVNIGRYFERDDGVAGCDETSIVKTAMTSLGYGGDPGKLLTDIGYTKQGDSYIRPASGDTMNTTVVDKYQQRDYAKYAALQYIFNNDTSDRGKCELIEPPTGKSPAQITYKKVVKNDNGEWVVQDTKAEFQTEYLAKSNKVNYDYKAGALNSATCIDLRTEMDGLVNAVVTYNKQHQDDPITDGLLNGGQAECNKDSPTWNEESQTCSDDTPTCTDQIKGIGWLICPTMEFLASVNDYAYGFLASSFLEVDTSLVTGSETAWTRFKDLANIAFVVALLFVIYSQITSVGISNYGIKKMLPKIIIAALLVNLSFIICKVAVDLSNVLGYGIVQFFEGIQVTTLDSSSTASDAGMAAWNTAGYWGSVVGGILIGGVGIALAFSIPVVLSSLLAIALIALILMARKALIVLLIVIAPLAFVAYLLPNTEKWFKSWGKLFSTLLLLFPIVGAVFGASALAARILADAAEDDPMLQLTALGVSALPFFVVPGLLKGSLKAAGALGAKLQGMADGAGKRVGSKAKDSAKNSYIGRNYAERQKAANIRRGLIAGGTYKGRRPISRMKSAMFNKLNSSRLSGEAGSKMAASGAALAQKEKSESVDNEVSRMLSDWGPNEELANATKEYEAALKGNDVVKARAAQKILLSKGNAGVSAIEDVVSGNKNNSNVSGDAAGLQNQAVAHAKSDLASAGLKGKNAALNAWSYDDKAVDASGNKTGQGRSFQDVKNDASTYTSLTDQELVTQSDATLKHARQIGALDKATADRILANKDLHKDLYGKKYTELYTASGTTPPPGGTP